MTFPGAGGQVPPRPDQKAIPQPAVPVSPGGNVVRASKVIIIGSAGELLVYSPTAAAGNLIASIAGQSGTDPYGNTFEEGIAAYVTTGGKTYALQLGSQQVEGVTAPAFWIADLTSPGFEPPAYTATQSGAGGSGAEIYSGKSTSLSTPGFIAVEDSTESGVTNGLIILGAGQVQFLGPVSGGLAVDTLTVNGSADTGGPTNNSTSTNGLTNGQISGTSGAQSAGTAHTHGPGSYAVTSGQHAHNMNNHAHPL